MKASSFHNIKLHTPLILLHPAPKYWEREKAEEKTNILSSMFQKCLRKRLRMIIKDLFRPVPSLNIINIQPLSFHTILSPTPASLPPTQILEAENSEARYQEFAYIPQVP